ncbi:sigma 54-interacting transcriptional regulator [Acetohalobium arabaticum]|uniref:HTH-type transcriptional regulatory protein TyrR n=1 Tax=Acetohalobium arabaticum (strain ATCC 49924 / DSM 5501 / Z-7288) TaxID=574087 RepID=D9QS50_ACEAZ|nr:sigma 54-interacting transcriptional regulator [Acetohalobium arabaticum]ADL13341.1 putative sigma54 specific transcriptional regulator [Acetohalobium arabaticum DSM 5501]
MKVAEIMTKDPITLCKEDTIGKAAEIFHNERIDGAPVVDAENKLIGIFTKSHLMKAVKEGLENSIAVGKLMQTDVMKITEDRTLESAWKIKIGRLPVVDKDNGLVGILTRTDLVEAFYTQSQKVVGELTTILDSSHNGIIAIDVEGRIITFNSAAEEILGYKAEEVLGRQIADIIPNTGLINVLETGEEEFGEKINVGDVVALTNRSLIYKDGELRGSMAIFQDISELEKVSEELNTVKNLNKELDAIIESVSDGLYVTDGNADTIRINSAYEEITGIKSEEVLGRNMEELVEEGIFSEAVTFQVLEKEESVSVMHDIKTGKQVLSTGNPVFNEEGEIVRVVTTARDVEELNHLKQELEKTKELSEKYYSELEKLRSQQLEFDEIVIKSGKMERVFDLALQVGRVDSTVLITGESGVGKEIIARTIHKVSDRRDGSLIKVNCGAIPDNLLEAELFGYEEGAFTGAKSEGKMGMFELANDGTLFLDEIGELPLNLQVKLLRALQEKEIMRVGGTESIDINARIISATNQDLEQMTKEGKFREDLYYRLNVVPIYVPPLRERKEDITPLISHFLQEFNEKFEVNKTIASAAIEALENYDWMGNVRELENLIERLVVMTSEQMITLDCLPEHIKKKQQGNLDIEIFDIIPLKQGVSKVEEDLVKMALDKYGSTYKAAEVLGVSQPTVVRKKQKYGI